MKHLKKFRRLLRILGILLLLLLVSVMGAGYQLYANKREHRLREHKLVTAQARLQPYEESISRTILAITETLLRVPEFFRAGIEPHDIRYHELLSDTITAIEWYTHDGREVMRITKQTDGTVVTTVGTSTTPTRARYEEVHTLQEGEIYMSRLVDEKDKTEEGHVFYATALYTREHEYAGIVVAFRVPLQSFFSAPVWENADEEHVFVVDAEGRYLYHHDILGEADIAFFNDFPDTFPDILEPGGRRMVQKRDGRNVFFDNMYPAFEVTLEGKEYRLPIQRIPTPQKKWIIGTHE